jgi:hypothetical protein
MRNKFILFLCLYLASAVLVVGLALPPYISAIRAVKSDGIAFQKSVAYYQEQEQAWAPDLDDDAKIAFADSNQLSSDQVNAAFYKNVLYSYILASVAYWIIVVGLLLFWKQKDVQANG